VAAEKHVKNNKQTVIVVGLLVAVVAAVAVVFGFNLLPGGSGGLITDHERYYPERTAFYLELAPGESIAERAVTDLDRVLTVMGDGQKPISFADAYGQTFDPEISLGFWDMKSDPGTGQTSGSFLAVLKTKPDVTLQQLAENFKIPKESYTIQPLDSVAGGTLDVLVSNKPSLPEDAAAPQAPSQTVMAIHDNHLLLTSTQAVLEESLGDADSHKSLMENTLFLDNLKRLEAKRQGTVLISSAQMNSVNMEDPAVAAALEKAPSMKKLLEYQQEFIQAAPVSVGGLVVDEDTRIIRFTSLTPLNLSKLSNPELREDFKKLLTDVYAFNVPSVLPQSTLMYLGVANLSSFYDMYMTYIASAPEQGEVDKMEQGAKMVGLDLRKNIVGLLDGKFGISLAFQEGQPDVSLFVSNNENTQKTMEQLSLLATSMLQAEKTEKSIDDSHTLTLLASPAAPMNVAYGNVMDDTLVMGTQNAVESVFSVQQHKSDSLGDTALYRELTASMPTKATMFFYSSFQEMAVVLKKMMEAQPPANLADAQKQQKLLEMLNGIEGIAAVNTSDSDTLLRSVISVKLAKR
jgi:hypothetical protein